MYNLVTVNRMEGDWLFHWYFMYTIKYIYYSSIHGKKQGIYIENWILNFFNRISSVLIESSVAL